MQCKDKFLLQGVTASPGVTAKDVTPEMFSKEAGYLVEETKLRVTYVSPPQPPSPVHEGSEEGSSPRASVSDNGVQASEFSFQRSNADKVEPQENTSEARALITKLTGEKQSAIQLNNKLQRELDQLRRDSKRSQSGIPLIFDTIISMGSAADEIVKLKESSKLLDIDEIIGKAKMHAAEAYSHAKEAYSLRDEFFKLIEQHAHADHLDSGTKERLSLAAASLNAALGVADAAAVAIASMSSRAAQGNPCLLDYNLLAAKASSSEPPISRAYESSAVLKDEKAANLDAGEIEALAPATKDLISEDAALIKPVADDAVTSAATDSKQAKSAARTESTKLDSRPHREAVARDKKILSCEEEVRLEEEQGCEKATTNLEKMAHLKAVREGLAPLEEVAAANIVASATDPDQDNSALLAAKTASTNLDYGERLARRKAVREGLARGKIDFLLEEEKIRLEAQGKAAEEDAAPPEAVAVAAANVAASERRARREAVREGLARAKIDLLREEEGRRLEEEGKAEKEYRKKKREEENKMRDDKRKQKMDKNTKPKGKGKK
ncbi:hypothetical protein Bca4012_039962 [Brassica carinata]